MAENVFLINVAGALVMEPMVRINVVIGVLWVLDVAIALVLKKVNDMSFHPRNVC